MADPFSAGGLAVGVISLGIQVGSGIIKYLDAVKGRPDDIEFVRRQADGLTDSLQLLESSAARFQAEHPAATAALERRLASVRIELQALEAIVTRFTAHGQPTTSLHAMVKTQARKLMFPFERAKVELLERRLQQTNIVLTQAIKTLQLDVSWSAAGKLATMESTTQAASAELNTVRTDIFTIDSSMRNITATITAVDSHVAHLDSKIKDERQVLANCIQKSDATQQASLIQLTDHITDVQHAQLLHGKGLDEIKLSMGVWQIQSQRQSRNQHTEIQKELKELQKVTTELTRRVISRPGALKELCDVAVASRKSPKTASWEDYAPDTTSISLKAEEQRTEELILSFLGTRPVCLCRPHRGSRRINSSFARLPFFSEITHKHTPGCPGSKLVPSSWEWYGGITTPLQLRPILNLATRISCALTYGAGGFSISPRITFYPTVNADTDQSFQILTLILKSIYNVVWVETVSKTEWKEFIALATAKLLTLFRNQHASPRAVDSYNRTLVYYAAKTISGLTFVLKLRRDQEEYSMGPLMRLLKMLLEHDSPAALSDLHSNTPLSIIIFAILYHYKFPAATNIVETLLIAGHNTQILDRLPPCQANTIPNIIDLLSSSSDTARALGCGPLSLAILSHNCEEVERLLKQYPSMSKEQNHLGQTPFHLAAGHAPCLELLLEFAADSELGKLPRQDFTPLEYALILSGKRCRNGTARRKCTQCHCARPSILIMRAKDMFMDLTTPDSSDLEFTLQNILNLASERCRRRYVSSLGRARLELTNFALKHLGAAESDELGLQDNRALDIALPRVSKLLEGRGIQIPHHLIVPDANCEDFRSVHLQLYNPDDAELFWRNGFRDMAELPWWKNIPRAHPSSALGYIKWLGDHGADLVCSPVNARKGILSGHITFYYLGQEFRDNRSSKIFDSKWLRTLIEKAVPPASSEHLADNCECACLLDHCTPFVSFLRGLFSLYEPNPAKLAHYCIKFLAFMWNLQENHHRVMVRFLTYQALEFPHTCRNRWEHAYRVDFDSDSETDEDGPTPQEFVILEQLLEKLEPSVTTIFHAGYNPDCEEHQKRLIQFWEHIWVNTVQDAIDRRDQGCELTQQEREGGEVLGVVWEDSNMAARTELSNIRDNPHSENCFEHWFFKLDKLVPEVKRPGSKPKTSVCKLAEWQKERLTSDGAWAEFNEKFPRPSSC